MFTSLNIDNDDSPELEGEDLADLIEDDDDDDEGEGEFDELSDDDEGDEDEGEDIVE